MAERKKTFIVKTKGTKPTTPTQHTVTPPKPPKKKRSPQAQRADEEIRHGIDDSDWARRKAANEHRDELIAEDRYEPLLEQRDAVADFWEGVQRVIERRF